MEIACYRRGLSANIIVCFDALVRIEWVSRPLLFFIRKLAVEALRERISKIAAEAARNENFEFVHLEITGSKRNSTVRVFIDKPGGVTLDDCVNVSHKIESVLDAEDFIPGRYVLEVSSPGIERELFTIEDFVRFIDKPARIKTNSPVAGKQVFHGIIQGVEDGEVVFDDSMAGLTKIPYSVIRKANLKIDLEAELRRR